MITMGDETKRIKVNKIVRGKSFRLIDFQVYDESRTHSPGNSDGERQPPTRREDDRFVIQMFGINERGETAAFYIRNYTPFFYIKVGENWTQSHVDRLYSDIKNKLGPGSHGRALVSATLVEHHKLYGFTGGKMHKFAKLVFTTSAGMNKVKGMWYRYNEETGRRISEPFVSQNTRLELYESNIPPLLRYFHINSISPSGWVLVKTDSAEEIVDEKRTTCNYEYNCRISDLKPQPTKETRVPYKICSFDIEASSSHGDFPVPVKTYKRMVANLVDAFSTQQKLGMVKDRDTARRLVEKIILAAFGPKYAKYAGIDLVYPKYTPSKKELVDKIAVLLDSTIENLKTIESEIDVSHLNNIENLFESIKEAEDLEGGEGGETDGPGSGEEAAFSRKKPAKKAATKTKTSTILDLLMSDAYDRDDKIQMVNDMTTRSFPQLEGDKVTFIGSTFMRYGEPEPYLNHCLVLNSCDPILGVEVVSVNTESELLTEWAQLIQTEDPDIIIGYNIFGFDYEFMFRRAEENYCVADFLKLSRRVDEVCATEDRNTHKYSIENTKIILATGEYDLRYPKISGRIQIDMYTYFRRDFNLPSYKLDDVAGQYISDDVKRIDLATDPQLGPVTELYTSNITGLHGGDYIHIEISGFTSDYYRDGHKFRVVDIVRGREVREMVKGNETTTKYNIIRIAGHESIDHTGKTIKWGMAKDDVSPQDIFRLSNGSSADRAIVAKYCIQDCNLVHHLMNKIDVMTGYVEMSRICSVPISFLVFRGQGIKLTSYVAKKCREKNTLMPDLEKTFEADGYEGAIVLPPKCAMYMDNPVACVDYASLYPSSMISQNYSHDSKVWTKEYDLDGGLISETGEKRDGKYIYDNMPGYEYIDIEFDTFKNLPDPTSSSATKLVKTLTGRKVCRWAQLPQGQKSIMPSILEELLKARADTRKMIKQEKDPFMQNILDKRQLGYKVTANSLYGQCGARTSTFYEKDVAASTTATGRMMITYAKRMIEQVYGNLQYDTECHGLVRTKAEYVYGDTDSVFFTLNLEDPETGEKIRGQKALETTIEIAQDVAKLCTQWLKLPMELTYEKTLMPFILLSKKRYVGMLYETDPKKGKMKYMGLSLKRRDSCDYLKDTYGGILNILMKENDIQKAIEFLDKSLNELVKGNVSMDKLAITKALRGYYKNPAQIAHSVLAERIAKRDPGNKPKPGDRMKFVHIVNETPKALQGDKIETPEFILQKRLKIDYTFYITNQLMKPLQQLFGLALEQIWTLRNKRPAITAYRKEMAKLELENSNLETFMKKKEKYCSAKVKTLLFDGVLSEIYNEKHGIQTIGAFFSPK
jgi:DNA polymerase elongation subunit (family B)